MIKVHWWTDGQGHRTLHLNRAGRSFRDSFLGEIWDNGDGWVYKLRDQPMCEVRFRSGEQVSRALERAVSGSQMNPSED